MFGISFGKNRRINQNKPLLRCDSDFAQLYNVSILVKRNVSAHHWVEVCDELDCISIGNVFVNDLMLPSTVKSRYFNYG